MADIGAFLPLILIVVVFYFFIIRPTRTRQRAALELQNSVVPGQRILTTAGLYGTVVAVDDDAVVLETSPGVTSRWARPAIARILEDVSEDTLDPNGASARRDGDAEQP